MVERKSSGLQVVEPHPELRLLLKKHGMTWGGFRKGGRPAKDVPEQRRAVVRDLQLAGHTWAEMVEITGMSQGFIQRNRDPKVSLRPDAVFLTCAWCGGSFQDSPSNVTRKRMRGQRDFYCSKVCGGRGYSASRTVSLVCGVCGEQFSRKAGQVAAHERRGRKRVFCSTPCANQDLIKPYRVQNAALFDYLAGVVCGDGCVVRDKAGRGLWVSIAVGFKDAAYADVLSEVVKRVFGFPPTVRENREARAMYVNLYGIEAARLFGPIKKPEGWGLGGIQHPEEFLAGLCDTDGGWPKKRGVDTRRAFNITQKNTGNLERTLPLWAALGIAPGIRHYTSKQTGYRRSILRVFAADIDRFKVGVPLRHPQKAVKGL